MSKEIEDRIREEMKVWELYAKKLAELEVKRQLENHYAPMFKKHMDLLEKYVTLLKSMAKNSENFEKTLQSLNKRVQEIHDFVFEKKSENYMA